ncbi:MAG: penicillin-binding transpeptidase domain-containing protein [Gemmatimonadota bacterium]|nr:penicillin-binding transpeptidase domain-containing protein [Gemmatimonadota bacterium]
MAKPANRIQFLQVVLLLGFVAVAGRLAQVQLVQHERWAEEAVAKRTRVERLPARRGTIYDRNGVQLANAQDFFRVQIATNEVTDTAAVINQAVRRLGASRSDLVDKFRNGPRRYPSFYGPFTATEVDSIRRLGGVHLTKVYQRAYPSDGLARPVIGELNDSSGHGVSGLERMLDSVLAGVPGEQVSLRDGQGQTYESPQRLVRNPVDGLDVVLTLDAELQSIAESELDRAISQMDADGGDVVFLDPRSGELLAVASRAANGAPTSSVFTVAFEPGSTAKLFTAAALLSHDKVTPEMTVQVAEAPFRIPGRPAPISDAKLKPGSYSLAHAIEVSSNIATVKFGQLLSPEEHYDTLRDFGFDSPTGVELPREAVVRLPPPDRWNPADHGPSMSMGYRMQVTPIQLAVAYGAIANDGVLMAPTLVREIRTAGGEVSYRHQPDTVRRVVSTEVAATLREFLDLAAGESGTGGASQLAGYRVAGKTGTSRRVVDGRYTETYISSFAGLFPAEDPQFVVIVKIENPRGAYYGGETAAPLLKAMLELALQARQSTINRGRAVSATVTATAPPPDSPAASTPAIVITLPRVAAPAPAPGQVTVPDVTGQSVRAAALALHRRGLQVRVRGSGSVTATRPAAGSSLVVGSIVDLTANRP